MAGQRIRPALVARTAFRVGGVLVHTVHMRTVILVAVFIVFASGCTASAEPTTTTVSSTTSTTETATTSTASPPIETTTTTLPPDHVSVFSYAVVAETNARRLAVIDPTSDCAGEGDVCELAPVRTIDLPSRPHNLTSVGAIVYATHPDARSVSRIDIETGEVLTERVGHEPHDIKYDEVSGTLLVTDESGKALLFVDPDTLEVVDTIPMPGQAHDLVVQSGTAWVTLIGRAELARVVDGTVEVLPANGSPHDLMVVPLGRVYYSNWGSNRLNIFVPETGASPEAPAGVGEPQYFALSPRGVVWVSDIAAGAIVGFGSRDPNVVIVGDSPHHLAFIGDTIVVAVSGSGEAVFVRDGVVIARSNLSKGLHGVAIILLDSSL